VRLLFLSAAERSRSPYCLLLLLLCCQLPDCLHHSFDYVVIDPPFITEDVWRLYARAARLLLGPSPARVLLSTIPENCELMRELLDARLVAFRPSIPHLIYQYSFFTNYTSQRLAALNPEIDSEEADTEQHTARRKTALDSFSSEQMLTDDRKQAE
jgi:hypothetical protein